MKKTRTQITVAACLLAVHLAADVVLMWVPRRHEDVVFFIGVAIPMSQTSLLAIWACLSNWKSYIRFPVALFGVAWTYYVEAVFIPTASRSESAKFAFMMAVQGAIIVIAISLFQFIRWLILRIRHSDSLEIAEKGQFSIGSMLIWTTMVAFLLGLGKMVLPLTGWTSESIAVVDFLLLGMIGVFNAIFALVEMACLFSRINKIVSTLIALFLIGMLAWAQAYLLPLLSRINRAPEIYVWLILAGVQFVCLFATLAPLRWSGWFEPVHEENGDLP